MTISIITTTYNSGKTIADTLKSVLAQTYKNIDYWIVDGCSTDNTLDIIHEYEPLFEGRLHYISEPDKGLYDAMNKGIERCTGDVVGILNSDDFYTSPDVLARVADEFARCKDIDAVYGDVHFVREEDLNRCVRYYSSKRFAPRYLRFGFMPAHPSFYVKRSVYQEAGGYALDYKIASDYDMMVRLFHKHKIRANYIAMDFVTMRTGGVSNANMKSRLLTTREDVKACRRYGLYSNLFFVSLKYLYKIFEFKTLG